MPIVGGGGGGSGAISGVTVTGTAASGQVPVASSSSAGAWAYPPGYEINYTQITSPVNITGTSEAAGTTVLSPGAVTFDGGPVMCEFFGLCVTPTAATSFMVVSLFESTTQITRLAFVDFITGGASEQFIATVDAKYRFTPSAGAHTYTVSAYVPSTGATPNVGAGAGGTGGNPPAFVRFTKV